MKVRQTIYRQHKHFIFQSTYEYNGWVYNKSSTIMSEPDKPYKLTIALEVLEHLGDGLYSNVAAVLTEAVANSWDADATKVNISLDIENDKITLMDNGNGMDRDEVNNRFLTVGYKKRIDGDVTNSGRPVMGRKGIGKLSLFSISNNIEVFTKKAGNNIEAFKISIPDLKSAITTSNDYFPNPIDNNCEPLNSVESGTFIKLSQLRTERLASANAISLRRHLARRFSIIGSNNFSVFINDNEVSPKDREELKFAQYIWIFGNTIPEHLNANIKTYNLPNRAEGWNEDWIVSGWIATVDKPTQLKTNEGTLNSLIVLSRGRLADEDILPVVTNAEIYTKYVTGQIQADFLDLSNDVDIITSNRQKLREDNERVLKLTTFISSQMREIANSWSDLRNTDKTDELSEKYPKVKVWLETLQPGWQRKAHTLLSKVATMEFDKEQTENETKGNLIRHAIYGFERLRLRGEEEALAEALNKNNIEAVLKLFADRDSLEAALYRDIVINRLSVINDFKNMVDENDKEKVLQRHLFNNLWLLDPAWDRATENTTMEERLKLLTPFKNDEQTKEKFGRVDIKYIEVSGKHVIVELKRASANPTKGQLLDQVSSYVKAYKNKFPEFSNIEVAIVTGKHIDGAQTAIAGEVPGSIAKTYDSLIVNAQQAYSDYLEKSKEFDFIENILN